MLGNNAKRGGRRPRSDGANPAAPPPGKAPGKAPGPRTNAPVPAAPAPAEAQNKKPTQPQPNPQYRYQADIEDPQAVPRVLNMILDTKYTVTGRDLCSISDPLRKGIKDVVMTKRHPFNLIGLEVEEPDDESEETHLVAYGNEPGSDHSHPIPPTHTRTSRKHAAYDLMPIHVIPAIINDRISIDCILDTGSVVCVMSEDIWLKLGATLNPNGAITLETATADQSGTQGQVRDASLRIGDTEVLLQFQVMKDAAFDVLLGQPFFAVTECETKVFANGEQHITISSPQARQQRSRIPTQIRTVRCYHDKPDF